MKHLQIALNLILVAALGACAPVRQPDAARLAADQAGGGSVLDQKLAAQWERFDAARAAIIKRVADERGLMTREEWENLLEPEGNLALTFNDLQALRARQAKLAEASHAASEARSVLDLSKLRARDQVSEFCHDLPKGGMLHIHPWGTMDRDTANGVLTMVNPKIDFNKLADSLNDPGGTGIVYDDELQGLLDLAHRYPGGENFKTLTAQEQVRVVDLFFLPPGNHDFDRFTATFTAISALVFANPAVDPETYAMNAFFKRAKESNVSYIEISRNIIPKPAWFNGLDAWAADIQQRYGITVRLLAAYNRGKDAEFTRGKADQLLKMPSSNILTGINFQADETAAPALERGQTLYVPVYAAYKDGDTKLKRSMHAGELGDRRNVRDALIMGAERIGHGVKLMEDPLTIEYARTHNAAIEVNLMSNERLKVAESTTTHPFLHFLRLGIKVSLSTDDEGIFESTIDDECRMAVTDTDVTYDELKQMSFNALETAFVDQPTKDRLVDDLTRAFSQFEEQWRQNLAGSSGG